MAAVSRSNLLRLPKILRNWRLAHRMEHPIRGNSTKANPRVLEHLSNRSLIKVSGTEASDFLQGLVTNDMRFFDDGAANIYTLFLNTKGRVMYESLIYRGREEASFYVECDRRISSDLQKHLKIYRIRRKVDIAPIDDAKIWSTFDTSVFTGGSNDFSSEGTVNDRIFPCGTLNNKSTKSVDDITIYEDPRTCGLNLRIVSKGNVKAEEIAKHLDFEVSMDESLPNYTAFRYRLGIGEGIDDLPVGKALPLEINCDYLHGVSFHKGCYIGQELTARTHHTGVVRKRLMGLSMKDCPEKTFNYDESIVDEAGKVVGKFRGKEGIYGLGLMRIAEVANARRIEICKHPIVVEKPPWWPKEPEKKDTISADSSK